MSHRPRNIPRMRAAVGVPAPPRPRPIAATGATHRRFSNRTPDSVALKGDPWAIGLAAITSTIHTMGLTHIRVMWWHPVFGTGEHPPIHYGHDSVFEVAWTVHITDSAGGVLATGRSAFTSDHGVGIVDAGAACIRAYLERQAKP